MREFRTELGITAANVSIGLRSGVLTQGSCFSEAIGQRMLDNKLNALVNPFGVIYNPESIHKVLSYAVFNELMPEHTFVRNQDVYLNYDVHSEFSSLRKNALMERLSNTVGAAHYFLKDAGWLLLTYGTAWIFQRKDTGEAVANCHKLPGQMFSRSLMSTEAIVASFATIFQRLKNFNPGIKVILTVSPVRHLKDTLELNSVSKAALRLACHEICLRFEDVSYFPAFEIMIDDLRDYRFYKSDLLHPTADAEDYIWEKFMERYFSSDLREFIPRWQAVRSALNHRPFHPESSAHQQFLADTLKKLDSFAEMVDVRKEIDAVRKQLI